MDIKKLKAKSKTSLKKNYRVILYAILILFVLSSVCNAIAYMINTPWLATLLNLIVDALFMLGFVKMIMKTAKNQKIKIEQLFNETESFFKYIGVTLIISVILLILFLLAAIAFKSLLIVMTYHNEVSLALTIILVGFGIILEVAILLTMIYISIAFSQVLFIMNDEPKLSVRETLSKSFDLMENYIIEYFILIISFIGWILLGIITFGIALIWTIPYMMVTMANFYEKIKKEYKKYNNEKEPEKIFNNKDQKEVTTK